jgi:hypothetical protein
MRVETVNWYWHRLRAMSGAEIAGRIAVKTRALGERRSRTDLEAFRLGPAQGEPGRLLPNRAEAGERVRTGIEERAGEVRSGRWELFGWKAVAMPDPPRWGWDGVHERSAPLEGPAAALDHRHLAGGADPRVVWEVNRWTELVVLAQSAWLNGRLDDARLAQRWLTDWVERNPTGTGINWTSALEAGLRLAHFTWIDVLLRACGEEDIRREQDRLAARVVPGHVWWVWRNRSFGSSANNHLLGELAGLILACWRWPSLMRLGCCAESAWQELQKQAQAQFAADGGNREQALHYHLFAWELIWQARRVMGAGNPMFEGLMARAGGYFAELTPPKGDWDFGDSDDAVIMPAPLPGSSAAEEMRGWLTGEEGPGENWRFWLGKPPVIAGVESGRWKVFEESGHAVKREGEWMARFDASPLGFGSMAAHGHLDALHVSVWHGGRAVLVDPGTGAYYSDTALRARMADWSAHNGPVPESGRAATRRMGPFLWTGHHEPPRLGLEEGDVAGCMACDGPFVKRRAGLGGGGLVVEDRVCNSQPHVVRWTLAPGWEVEPRGGGRFRLRHPDGTRLRLEVESVEGLDLRWEDAEVAPKFLRVERARALTARFTGVLRTRLSAET